jgi:hypothetical protein
MPKTTEQLLGKARNRVRLVGVELEGGWIQLPSGSSGIIRDGSVSIPAPTPPEDIIRRYNSSVPSESRRGTLEYAAWSAANPRPEHIGELPSQPMPVKDLDAWVTKFYPSHVNETCGLHIHMSFNTLLTYQRLMTPAFEPEVISLLRKWAQATALPPEHPLFTRLAGKSRYCRLGNTLIDAQARLDKKNFDHHARVNRYTAVNYAHATHGTIEIRVLPMFDTADLACEALHRVIDITNAFVLTQIYREAAERVIIEAEDGTAVDREEIRECV